MERSFLGPEYDEEVKALNECMNEAAEHGIMLWMAHVHSLYPDEPRMFECIHCMYKQFPTEAAVSEHMTREHGVNANTIFKCVNSGVFFPDKATHQKDSGHLFRYKCTYAWCVSEFGTLQIAQLHARLHCTRCHSEFWTPEDRDIHIVVCEERGRILALQDAEEKKRAATVPPAPSQLPLPTTPGGGYDAEDFITPEAEPRNVTECPDTPPRPARARGDARRGLSFMNE